mmetsp:Transcript_63200/g.205066  ORF Transcript_63200/g.205066 Transcript_63200/m.205066 type:complete len:247 (+) Transcript_63200:43-783(+)
MRMKMSRANAHLSPGSMPERRRAGGDAEAPPSVRPSAVAQTMRRVLKEVVLPALFQHRLQRQLRRPRRRRPGLEMPQGQAGERDLGNGLPVARRRHRPDTGIGVAARADERAVSHSAHTIAYHAAGAGAASQSTFGVQCHAADGVVWLRLPTGSEEGLDVAPVPPPGAPLLLRLRGDQILPRCRRHAPATAPQRRSSLSMINASHSGSPASFNEQPRPALSDVSFSSTFTAASTASTALPPFERTA